jgi:filamentous hemagglutinin family protein
MNNHAALNKIFRLIWSQVHQTWIAVSETTRGQGKKASRLTGIAAPLLIAFPFAQAGPLGGQVSQGTGTIAQAKTTTTVTQASQNLSLSWQSFNTTSQETVNFIQPSATAIAVNRIADTNPTQFFGRLNANGQVYLVNPNGILFGAGSQVNVGALVASTLDFNDSSLGDTSRTFSGGGSGRVTNQGSITAAAGGHVALIGNKVGNQGDISAPGGTVSLAAGSEVTLTFDRNRLLSVQVDRSTLDNLAENGGLLRADGGTVLMSAGAKDAVLASAVNNTGIVEARSVRNVNGTIVFDGGNLGALSSSGTLDASGKRATETGGTVKLLGNSIGLEGGAVVDVSGDAGGGKALIGGNFHGEGSEQHAQALRIAPGASIGADAIDTGNGGDVAVWSVGTTRFDGKISARGGSSAGNGGMVETSGATLKIGAGAVVDTWAAHGTSGIWLLDPMDITIGNRSFWGNTLSIDVDSLAITNALNVGNVTIQTTGTSVGCSSNVSCNLSNSGAGDIRVMDNIGGNVDYDNGGQSVSWNTGNYTLTLSAYRNVHFVTTLGVNSPTAGNNIDVAGAVDLFNNSTGGQVVLRADNAATGTGTVLFDNPAGDGLTYLALNSNNSFVNIYYNPVSYAAPTDYTQYLLVGNTSKVISHMAVNVTATVDTKTYDANNSATLSGLGTVQSLPSGVTLDGSGVNATFSDKNAGVGKTVTLTGVTFGGGGTTITHGGENYYLNGLDSRTGTITKANLSVTGVTASAKTYDATTTASLAGTAAVTALGGDVVSVSGTGAGTFATKDSGTNKAVTVTGYSLAGSDANNYTVVQPTGLTANINRANLSVTGVTASDKTYDATTAASLAGTAAVTALGSDVVSVSGTGAGSFADKNAGTNKALTVTGYSLAGSDANNYTVVQPTGLTATITKANLSVTGITVSNKPFDGTAFANVDTSGVQFQGKVAGDAITLTSTGAFADTAPGNGKTVNLSNSYGGLDIGNYTIADQPTATANINGPQSAAADISKVVTQMQSAVLPFQASTQQAALSVSSTVAISRGSAPNDASPQTGRGNGNDTGNDGASDSGNGKSTRPAARGLAGSTSRFDAGGPKLRIVGAGIHLPDGK